jgi:hypothetical protein
VLLGRKKAVRVVTISLFTYLISAAGILEDVAHATGQKPDWKSEKSVTGSRKKCIIIAMTLCLFFVLACLHFFP